MESTYKTKVFSFIAAIIIMIVVSLYFPIIRTRTVTNTTTNVHVFTHDSIVVINSHQYKHIDTCQTCKLEKAIK